MSNHETDPDRFANALKAAKTEPNDMPGAVVNAHRAHLTIAAIVSLADLSERDVRALIDDYGG
jgi:hypothetical protein